MTENPEEPGIRDVTEKQNCVINMRGILLWDSPHIIDVISTEKRRR